jgi:hypothetical protein
VTTHCREGRLDHGVRHDADGSRVGSAREAAAEVPKLAVDLTAEVTRLPAELRRPSPPDEIFTAVNEEQPRLAWLLAHPLRHVQRRREPGLARRRPAQATEKLVLERRSRA